jgi:hypothetical protein
VAPPDVVHQNGHIHTGDHSYLVAIALPVSPTVALWPDLQFTKKTGILENRYNAQLRAEDVQHGQPPRSRRSQHQRDAVASERDPESNCIADPGS